MEKLKEEEQQQEVDAIQQKNKEFYESVFTKPEAQEKVVLVTVIYFALELCTFGV
jgi:hypothetical protein